METSRGARDLRSDAEQRGGRLHARHEFGSRKGYTEAMLCACGRCELDCKPAGEGVTLPADKAERRRLLRTVRLDAHTAGGAEQIEKMVNGGARSYKLHRRHFKEEDLELVPGVSHRTGVNCYKLKRGARGIETMMEDVLAADNAGSGQARQNVLRSEGGLLPAIVSPPSVGHRVAGAQSPAQPGGGSGGESGEDELSEDDVRSKLRAVLRELEERKRNEDALKAQNADLQAALKASELRFEKAQEEIEKMRAEIRDLACRLKFQPLRSGMLSTDKHLSRRVRQYTGFRTAQHFLDFVALLDADGLLSAVDVKARPRLAAGDDDEPVPEDTDAGELMQAKRTRHDRRALVGVDAIFFVLMWLRTGMDIIDLNALFSIGYSTGCRYVVVYTAFLREFFEVELPELTEDQIVAATPGNFLDEFQGHHIQALIDAHEQEVQMPSSLPANRAFFSKYKHRNTCKFFGACTPCGAISHAPPFPVPGGCRDNALTRLVGFLDLAIPGMTTLADKGFMMQAEFAAVGHFLLTPNKAWKDQPTFTIDEVRTTNRIGNKRIHIERGFERGQDFKVLHKRIPISCVDYWGTVFYVVMMLANYDTPLIREETRPLMCMAEQQWGSEEVVTHAPPASAKSNETDAANYTVSQSSKDELLAKYDARPRKQTELDRVNERYAALSRAQVPQAAPTVTPATLPTALHANSKMELRSFGARASDPAGKKPAAAKPAPQPAVSSTTRAAKVPKARGQPSRRQPKAKYSTVLAVPLQSGAELKITRGNLQDFGTDPGFPGTPARTAIVNAANSAGLGGGGVDGAINAAGGASLHAARQAMMDAVGTITTGTAQATGPGTYGTLFGQTVLHAVAPNFRTRPVPSEDGLKSAYKAALALAEARKIEYLGFAFLGAGVFKGSKTLATLAGIAVEAVRSAPLSSLKEVHLFAFGANDEKALVAAAGPSTLASGSSTAVPANVGAKRSSPPGASGKAKRGPSTSAVGRARVSKRGHSDVQLADEKMLGLRGNEWLTCACINLVQQLPEFADRDLYVRSSTEQQRRMDFWPLTVDVVTQALKRYVRGERSRKVQAVFEQQGVAAFISNSGGQHWVGLFLDGRQRRAYHFDSLGGSAKRSLVTALVSAARKARTDWTFVTDGTLGRTNEGTPLQQDGFQCGVWVLQAERWFLQFLRHGGSASFDTWLRGVQEGRGSDAERNAFIAQRRVEYSTALGDTGAGFVDADLRQSLQEDGLAGSELAAALRVLAC